MLITPRRPVVRTLSVPPLDFSTIAFLGGFEGSNPVVAIGGAGETDFRIRETGNAVRDPNTSQYFMPYTGYNAGNNTDEFIHGATSPDGKVWTKCTNKPLIGARRGEDPYLVIDGSTYYIFGEDKTAAGGGSGNSTFIRLWSSPTFDADWDTVGTDHGQVFGPAVSGWDSWGVSSPLVWKEGATWFMLYEGSDTDWNTAEIGLATASSLTGPWTREPTNPVFAPADTSWPGALTAVVPDDIYKDAAGVYHLLYHARESADGEWRIGYAFSTSPNDLTAWTDGTHNPLEADVAPSAPWASTWMLVRLPDGSLAFTYYRDTDQSGIWLGYGLTGAP